MKRMLSLRVSFGMWFAILHRLKYRNYNLRRLRGFDGYQSSTRSHDNESG